MIQAPATPTTYTGRRRTLASTQEDSLQTALERLLASDGPSPRSLRALLERYLPFLVAEFDEEEGAEGLHGEILRVDPGLGNRVAKLRAEHRELLNSTRELIQLLRVEAPEAEASSRARRDLLRSLRAHRRAESQLLIDAHFQDLGGEGAR